MGKNRKIQVGSVLTGVAVVVEIMMPEMTMALTQNHNNKPYVTNQVTELLIQEIDETNGTVTVVVSENGLTENSREKTVEGNEETGDSVEKIVDISGWTYRQLNIMAAAGVSDGDLYALTSGYGLGLTVFNQTYETINIAKDTPTVLGELEVGTLSSLEEKELVYSLGVSYYYAETGRNRTWYIPGRINYSSCFDGLESTTGVVCEAETYEGENGMLMVRYKAKEGTTPGNSDDSGSSENGADGAPGENGGEIENGGEGGEPDENGGEAGGSGGDLGDGDSEGLGNESKDNDSKEREGSGSSRVDSEGDDNIVTVVKEVPVIQEVVKIAEKDVSIVTKVVETVVKATTQEVPVVKTIVREAAGKTVYVPNSGNEEEIKTGEARGVETNAKNNEVKKDVMRNGGMEEKTEASEETEVPVLGRTGVKGDWWIPFMIGLISGGTGMGVAWWIVGKRGGIKE